METNSCVKPSNKQFNISYHIITIKALVSHTVVDYFVESEVPTVAGRAKVDIRYG